MAFLGIVFCYSGDWERGLSLTRRAMDLNPHHPGWYRYATFFNEYRQRHYAEALTILQKINLPDHWPQHYTTAMTHAQLGNRSAATAEVERTLRLWPDFERDVVTRHIEKWIRGQPELVTHIIDGLELAGFRLRRPDGEEGASRPIDSPR
jgi:adenylate cyclase